MRKLVVSLLLILQFYSQDRMDYVSKIDDLFTSVTNETPGYAVSVVQNGKDVLNYFKGTAHLEHGIQINENTVFNIASLSKQFTAACIALLILDNKIDLDDPVAEYIDQFPSYDHIVRIKHLIYMTSGIPEYYRTQRKDNKDWSSLEFFSIDDAIESSLSGKNLEFKPGSQWQYSNINYMLMVKIVEKASGLRFSEFAKQRLFDPLGMTSTIVNDDIFTIIPNRALGYNHRDKSNTDWMINSNYIPTKGEGYLQINRHSPHYGGSGIYSSIVDIKKWVNNFSTRKFGGDAFYTLMHKRMTFSHGKDNDAFGLAFGDFNGREIVWYEGGDWGYSAYMMRFPKTDTSIIVLSNLGTGNARQKVNQVLDRLAAEGFQF